MKAEELVKEMKFKAVIISVCTYRILSMIQVLYDILSSKDGSIRGPRRDPNEPQSVTLITLNPDLFYASSHPMQRLGPAVENTMISSVMKQSMGLDVKFEEYGKPKTFNYDFAERTLQKRAMRQRIKISNYYMIGDNPRSDIAGANAKGWVSILVRTGVFDANAKTS